MYVAYVYYVNRTLATAVLFF